MKAIYLFNILSAQNMQKANLTQADIDYSNDTYLFKTLPTLRTS